MVDSKATLASAPSPELPAGQGEQSSDTGNGARRYKELPIQVLSREWSARTCRTSVKTLLESAGTSKSSWRRALAGDRVPGRGKDELEGVKCRLRCAGIAGHGQSCAAIPFAYSIAIGPWCLSEACPLRSQVICFVCFHWT